MEERRAKRKEVALKKAEIAKQDRMRSEEARRLEEEKSFKEEEALLAKQEEERRVRAHTLNTRISPGHWTKPLAS